MCKIVSDKLDWLENLEVWGLAGPFDINTFLTTLCIMQIGLKIMNIFTKMKIILPWPIKYSHSEIVQYIHLLVLCLCRFIHGTPVEHSN